MAQHNCEDLKPTDTPSTVPTTLQAFSDHSFNPKCAHNLMATQCNQSQYLPLMKQSCTHNPSASQVSQTNLSNSLASPYPPDLGEHVLKRSPTEVGEQAPVKWFKFIHPSPKPRMTETPVQKPVHVAYSPIASMNYLWTINLHHGYPPLQVLLPQEYIPPSLHSLCNFKPTMFHLGDDYLSPHKMLLLLPPEDDGERLLAHVTIKVVGIIEKADGERFQNLSYILGTDNGKVEETIPYSQLVDHLEGTANEENKTNDELYKFRELIGHQGPLKATDPNWKGCKYNVLVEWETGEKTYEPTSVLTVESPVTYTSYAKENDLLHIEGWKRFRNLAKKDIHDLSSLASPKGEMKSFFSWTSLFKSPTSSTLCFCEHTLGKLNQVKLLCSLTSSTLYDPAVANDTIYIKTQVFRLLRYYSPAPRNIARSDWVTQNITHNMTSSLI